MRARYSRTQGYVITNRRLANRPAMRTTSQRFSLGPTTAKFLSLSVLLVLAVIMLTRSSANSTGAYKQSELRQQIGASEQEIQQLRLEAQRAQSLQTIQNSALKQELQPMENAQYLESGEVAGASTAKP